MATYTVCVGVDGSKTSYQALLRVRHLFCSRQMDGLRIILCAAVPPEVHQEGVYLSSAFGGSYPIHSMPTDDVTRRNKEKQAAMTKILQKAGEVLKQGSTGTFELECIIVPREAGEGIVGLAEKHGADLIVIGSRNLGTVKRFLMGSTSNYITHHASCDVLIVKNKVEHE